MGIFKRMFRKNRTGKGMSATVSLQKAFDVLNYTPLDYYYLKDYADFYANAENAFRKRIANTNIDDLCHDMLDSYIESRKQPMLKFAKLQYTHHMDTIWHHKGILDGELIQAKGHLENLESDLADIEKQIDAIKKMRGAPV